MNEEPRTEGQDATQKSQGQMTEEMIGRTLGRYQILSLIGAGGMGEVYLAKDTNLGRNVAVKVLPAHLATHPEALARFEREAKAVAALSHPNILAIHDFGSEEGLTYAVMELLEGESLRERLQRSPATWREAVKIGAAVADGLAAAHAKGFIHRDIKPENVFLTSDGQIKILDFGVARVKTIVNNQAETLLSQPAQALDATRPGTLMGTIGYMSPEQVRGETADAPSDIFSLGCLLAEMVAGQRTFAGATVAETLAAILRDEPPPLTAAGPDVPPELERIVRRCLEKSPTDRFQSARDLSLDLRSLFTFSPASPSTSSTGRIERVPTSQTAIPVVTPPPARRSLHWQWMSAVILGGLVVLALAGWFVWRSFGSRPTPVKSLAVLPLANSGVDEYLSDGVTEGVINSLSQLPQLRVMAKSTVFRYKDKEIDPIKVGKELKVGAVLTGQVAQRNDEVTISAELVNVADGAQLWNGGFQRKLADLAVMQNEIAQNISDRLRLTLTGDEQERLGKRHTKNPEAYQLYLKGRYYINQPSEAETRRGLQYFEEAIHLDPGNAQAYAGLADAYFNLSNVFMPPSEAMPKSRKAAMNALQLDEMLGEAHASLAVVKSHYDWEWAEAEREYRRAIELNPGNAFAHQMYGYYLTAMGRSEEALNQYRLAKDLDPLSLSASIATIWPFYFAPQPARQYDKAADELRKLVRFNPKSPTAHGLLGLVLAETGSYDEANSELAEARKIEDAAWFLAGQGYAQAISGKRREAERALAEFKTRMGKGEHVQSLSLAFLHAGLGDKDQAFAALQKAYENRDEEMILLNVDPKFDRLRSDPRFSDLLRKMNLTLGK